MPRIAVALAALLIGALAAPPSLARTEKASVLRVDPAPNRFTLGCRVVHRSGETIAELQADAGQPATHVFTIDLDEGVYFRMDAPRPEARRILDMSSDELSLEVAFGMEVISRRSGFYRRFWAGSGFLTDGRGECSKIEYVPPPRTRF